MTAFLAVAVLLVAAALLCLLPPLLRRELDAHGGSDAGQANLLVLRDQARELDAELAQGRMSGATHAAAREELAERVLRDVTPAAPAAQGPRQLRTAAALAAAVPLLAAGLYLVVGEPAGIGAGPAPVTAGTRQHDSPAGVDEMVAALARRLQNEPGDIEGWRMLARSYSALERFGDAARIYAQLARQLPGEAGVLADYADALATAQGASLKGEPERLIARALALDPRHVKALSLAGSAAFERGDFALARQRWEAVLALVPADSAFAQSTSASIAAARARLAGAQGAPAAGAATASAAVSGTVSLAPALRADAAPGDTVFVYARRPDGAGPPLAALRRQVKDLPLRFRLDDSMGMGAARLSAHTRVIVGARISRSGSATAAAGDLEGATGPVAVNGGEVAVEIGRRRD